MAKFNYKEIARTIASSPQAAKRVDTMYRNRFNTEKQEFLKAFDAHPVTQEIKSGPGTDVSNISNTLHGKGNLASFIGFEDTDNPTDDVRNVLENNLVIIKSAKAEPVGTKVRYRFSLRIPEDEIKEASKMPWESGVSWVYGIERGISGFGNYLRGLFQSPDPSRSGRAIQAKHDVREGSFKTRPYLSELFKKLINAIGGKRR